MSVDELVAAYRAAIVASGHLDGRAANAKVAEYFDLYWQLREHRSGRKAIDAARDDPDPHVRLVASIHSVPWARRKARKELERLRSVDGAVGLDALLATMQLDNGTFTLDPPAAPKPVTESAVDVAVVDGAGLRDRARDAGLEPDWVLGLAARSQRLVATDDAGEAIVRVGGTPVTDPPMFRGEPLDLLAAIAHEDDWLLVFHAGADRSWGHERAEQAATRIEVVPAASLPTDPVLLLRGVTEWTIPPYERPGLEDEQLSRYMELADALTGEHPLHRLGGHPDAIQDDPLTEAARVVGPASWELLLQLDSDPRLGYPIGDEGRLYVCLPAAGAYDRAFTVVQSH